MLIIRFRAEGNADNEIKNLRGTLAAVESNQLWQNKNALVGATAEERKNINALQMANRAQVTVIRSEIEQARLRMQAIREIQRETQARERATEAQVRAARRETQARERATEAQVRAARRETQARERATEAQVRAARA